MTADEAIAAVVDAQASARSLREVADAAQDDYVEAVRAAIAAGVSVPDIAAACGVTRTGVYQALRRRPLFARSRVADLVPLADRAESRRTMREVDDAALVAEYDRYLEILFRQAEDYTRGAMLNREGRAAGLDPRDAFYSRRAGVRPWRMASEELKRAWSDGDLPRPLTLTEWRNSRSGVSKLFADRIAI